MTRPTWFADAVGVQAEQRRITVRGVSIVVRSWGDARSPGLVLVHGGGAHSGWWDHVAPLLAKTHRVVALDLSGHGDSGRRESYTFELWVAEVHGVIAASEFIEPPILIGHSMGGRVSLAASIDDAPISGVVIDSPLRDLSPEQTAAREHLAFGPLKKYSSFDDALRRFRTVPPQLESLPYVVDHVARHSIVEHDGSWSWKFDPRVFIDVLPTLELLLKVRRRIALVRAENGLLTETMTNDLNAALDRPATVFEIPLAGHHVMLDQPVALAAALRVLLAAWS